MGYHQVGKHSYCRSPRREEREKEKLFEEIIIENFPNLMKCMDTDIQEAPQTPSTIRLKKTSTEAYYNQTVNSQRQKILTAERSNCYL